MKTALPKLHDLTSDPWIYNQVLSTGNTTALSRAPIGYIISVSNLRGYYLWNSTANIMDDFGNLTPIPMHI